MLHRAVLVSIVIAFMAVLGLPAQAAGPHGVTCTLNGNASFTPGLTATFNPSTTYSFTGTLSGCQSTDSTLTSGSVTATGHATGSGLSCGGGTSAGAGTITWNNGTSTSLSFTTSGAGSTVVVQTTATSSTEPAVATGDTGAAPVAFETQTPQDCATTGLTSASFTGQAVTGAAS
jgi:hypothetical protein